MTNMKPLALAIGMLASTGVLAGPAVGAGNGIIDSGPLSHAIGALPPVCGSDGIFCDGFDGSGSTGGSTVYDNRDDFLAATAPGFYENGFDDAQGQSGALSYSDAASGIAYTVDSNSALGLWNGNGYISPSGSADQIVVTFTGAPVTAIGGNFWTSDSTINPFPGFNVVITLSDGTVETLVSTGPTDFRGFTSTAPITSISIDAPGVSGEGDNVWSAMDNLIAGSGQ